jgi:hypothetical protein
MSIVNRRNAVLGWVVWETGKRVAKRKAKSVVPTGESISGGRRKSAVAAMIAAVAGTLMFWRRRSARARAVPE